MGGSPSAHGNRHPDVLWSVTPSARSPLIARSRRSAGGSTNGTRGIPALTPRRCSVAWIIVSVGPRCMTSRIAETRCWRSFASSRRPAFTASNSLTTGSGMALASPDTDASAEGVGSRSSRTHEKSQPEIPPTASGSASRSPSFRTLHAFALCRRGTLEGGGPPTLAPAATCACDESKTERQRIGASKDRAASRTDGVAAAGGTGRPAVRRGEG